MKKFQAIEKLNDFQDIGHKRKFSLQRADFIDKLQQVSQVRVREHQDLTLSKITSKKHLKTGINTIPQKETISVHRMKEDSRFNSQRRSILSRVSSVNLINSGYQETENLIDDELSHKSQYQSILPDLIKQQMPAYQSLIVDDYQQQKSQSSLQKNIYPELDLVMRNLSKMRKPSLPHIRKLERVLNSERQMETRLNMAQKKQEESKIQATFDQNQLLLSQSKSQKSLSPQNTILNKVSSQKSIASFKSINRAHQQQMRDASVVIDQMEQYDQNQLSIEEYLLKFDELIQLQTKTVRVLFQGKDIAGLLLRAFEFQRNMLKDIQKTHNQVVFKFQDLINEMNLKKQNLEEEKNELEIKILKQKEMKRLGQKELEKALKEYMDTEMIVKSLNETLQVVEKQRYSDVQIDLENLQSLMELQTENYTPYQLNLYRDTSYIEDNVQGQSYKLFKNIKETVGKQAEQVQVETAKKIVKRFLKHPPILIDVEIMTEDDASASYRNEIDKQYKLIRELQKENANSKSQVSQLSYDLEKTKTQLDRTKGDLILIKSELQVKNQKILEQKQQINQMDSESQRLEKKNNTNRQAFESERSSLIQKIKEMDKIIRVVKLEKSTQADLPILKSNQTADIKKMVNQSLKKGPQSNEKVINQLQMIIEDKDFDIKQLDNQLAQLKSQRDQAIKQVQILKLMKIEGEVLIKENDLPKSNKNQENVKQNKEIFEQKNFQPTYEINEKNTINFERNISDTNSIKQTKDRIETNTTTVSKNISTLAQKLKLKIEQQSEYSEQKSDQMREFSVQVEIEKPIQKGIQKHSQFQMGENKKSDPIDITTTAIISPQDQTEINTQPLQLNEQSNQKQIKYVEFQGQSQLKQIQETTFMDQDIQQIQQEKKSERETKKFNSNRDSQINTNNLETTENIKTQKFTFNDSISKEKQSTMYQEFKQQIQLKQFEKIDEIQKQRPTQQIRHYEPPFDFINQELSKEFYELEQKTDVRPFGPSANLKDLNDLLQIHKYSKPLYQFNVLEEFRNDGKRSEDKLKSLMDEMRRNIHLNGIDRSCQTEAQIKKQIKVIMREQLIQTDIPPIKLIANFSQQVDMRILQRDDQIQKEYLKKLKQLFGEEYTQ